MKISIAMTTYNGSAYLNRQLESLWLQTQAADEVIIVDDCSVDCTVQIINNFIHNHRLQNWHLYRNDTNLGYIRNFQKAISLCTGTHIFTADQDDIWMPEKISTMAEIIRCNPDIQVLSSSIQLIDAQGNALAKSYTPFNRKPASPSLINIPFNHIIEKNCFPGCAMVFTSEIASAYLSSHNLQLPHDWALALLGSLKEGLYWYSSCLVQYRIHDQNTSGLPQVNCSHFHYALKMLSGWNLYIRHLKERILFSEYDGAFLTDSIKCHIDYLNKRCYFVENKLIRQYLFFIIKNYKIAGNYDRRGIILDFLLMFKFILREK